MVRGTRTPHGDWSSNSSVLSYFFFAQYSLLQKARSRDCQLSHCFSGFPPKYPPWGWASKLGLGEGERYLKSSQASLLPAWNFFEVFCFIRKFMEILHSTRKYIHVCLNTENVVDYLASRKNHCFTCLCCNSVSPWGWCAPFKMHRVTWSTSFLPALDAQDLARTVRRSIPLHWGNPWACVQLSCPSSF